MIESLILPVDAAAEQLHPVEVSRVGNDLVVAEVIDCQLMKQVYAMFFDYYRLALVKLAVQLRHQPDLTRHHDLKNLNLKFYAMKELFNLFHYHVHSDEEIVLGVEVSKVLAMVVLSYLRYVVEL